MSTDILSSWCRLNLVSELQGIKDLMSMDGNDIRLPNNVQAHISAYEANIGGFGIV